MKFHVFIPTQTHRFMAIYNITNNKYKKSPLKQQIQKIRIKKKRVQPIYAAHVVLKGHQIIDQNEGKENVEHEH